MSNKKIIDILKLPWLYSIESENAAVYNNCGIGELQIERLANGEPDCFLDPATKVEKWEPKILILRDNFSYFWSRAQETQFFHLRDCLTLLKAAGFQIYVQYYWTREIKLLETDEQFSQLRPDSIVYSDEELIQSYKQLRELPRKKIGFLNTEDINTIMATAYDEYESSSYVPLELKTINLMCKDDFPLDLCSDYLKKSNNRGAIVVKHINIKFLNAYEEFLHNRWANKIPVEFAIDTIDISPGLSEQKSLLIDILGNGIETYDDVKLICSDATTFDAQSWKIAIESIFRDDGIGHRIHRSLKNGFFPDFSSEKTQIMNTQSQWIESEKKSDDRQNLEEQLIKINKRTKKVSPRIENKKIEFVLYDRESIAATEKILAAGLTKRKVIFFKTYFRDNQSHAFKSTSLSSAEELELRVDLNGLLNILFEPLSYAYNLNKLTVSFYCKDGSQSTILSTKIPPLYGVEKMVFNCSDPTHSSFVDAFINQAPKLKELHITGSGGVNFDGVSYDEWVNTLNLDNVEYLNISESGNFAGKRFPDSPEKLFKLLKKMPKLRILNMVERDDLEKIEIPPGMDHLQLIYAPGVKISQNDKKRIKGRCISKVPYVTTSKMNTLDHHAKNLSNNFASINTSSSNDAANQKTTLQSANSEQFLVNNTKFRSLEASRNNDHPLHKIILCKDEKEKEINPNEYRINVFDEVELKKGLLNPEDAAFILRRRESFEFSPYDRIDTSVTDLETSFPKLNDDPSTKRMLLWKVPLAITNEWTALPNYALDGRITHLRVPGLERGEDYELQHDKKYNFCYIKFLKKKYHAVELEYIESVPLPPSDIIHNPVNQPISDELRMLVSQFKFAAEDTFPPPKVKFTAEEILNRLKSTKSGPCTEKCIAFSFVFKEKFPGGEVAIISNSLHSYIEARESPSSPWVRFDIGGTAGSLITHPSLFGRQLSSLQAVDESEPKNQSDLGNELITPNEPTSVSDENIRSHNPSFKSETTLENRPPFTLATDLLLSYMGENVLLTFKDDPCVEGMQELIREVSKDDERPICYIDSPKDIFCFSRKIQRDENNIISYGGYGPNSSLAQFLLKNHEKHPILLINWNRFTAEEIIRYNNVIDKNRSADRLNIPESATIIGLYNTKKTQAYKGNDFFRRFDHIISPNFNATEIEIAKSPVDESRVDSIIEHVNLHESTSWQRLLIGSYKLELGSTVFKPGPLIMALVNGRSLAISNAPWEDRDFQLLMNRIRIEKHITVAGVRYDIPESFRIIEGKPFSLQNSIKKEYLSITRQIESASIPNKDYHVLNPVTFRKLFDDHEVTDGFIISRDGWLVSADHGQIFLYLTYPLSDSQWGELIDRANQLNVKLNIVCKAGVTLPDAFSEILIEENNSKKNNPKLQQPAPLFTQNDQVVIDCTDISLGDLFGKIESKKVGGEYVFSQTNGLISNIIQLEKKRVVLTGTMSPPLAQYLAHYISINDFSKKFLVVKAVEEDSQTSANRIEPSFNERERDEGNFIDRRNNLINNALKTCPIVLIEGPTGVGKTTFIFDHYQKLNPTRIYPGLDFIEQWLTATEDNAIDQILFIDEANITDDQKHQWTEFSGLLDNVPPRVCYKGTSYILTDKHKVIFAGNPASYGGERHSPALFENYPVAHVTFNPLPDQVLIDNVLEPILGNLEDFDDVAKALMQVYHRVLALSGNEPWISPRELEHMAHLYLLYGSQSPTSCALIVARQVVPPSFRQAFDEPLSELLFKKPYEKLKNYHVTKSRLSLESRLNEFLDIRTRKISGELLKPGLGGMIIEGPPGCGKSEQVIAQLIGAGLKPNQDFYLISVGMPFSDKKALLEEAYRNGSIVVIDEFNSSPSMEKFFNDALTDKLLVMGPIRPGFLLIGTQNPHTMEGRREMSLAMQRRLLKVEVSAYPENEMIEILQKAHGVPHALAKEIVQDFELANKYKPISFGTLIKKFPEAIEFIRKNVKIYSKEKSKNEITVLKQALLSRKNAPKNKSTEIKTAKKKSKASQASIDSVSCNEEALQYLKRVEEENLELSIDQLESLTRHFADNASMDNEVCKLILSSTMEKSGHDETAAPPLLSLTKIVIRNRDAIALKKLLEGKVGASLDSKKKNRSVLYEKLSTQEKSDLYSLLRGQLFHEYQTNGFDVAMSFVPNDNRIDFVRELYKENLTDSSKPLVNLLIDLHNRQQNTDILDDLILDLSEDIDKFRILAAYLEINNVDQTIRQIVYKPILRSIAETENIELLMELLLTASDIVKDSARDSLENLMQNLNNIAIIVNVFKQRLASLNRSAYQSAKDYTSNVQKFLGMFINESIKKSIAVSFLFDTHWAEQKNVLNLVTTIDTIESAEKSLDININISEVIKTYLHFSISTDEGSLKIVMKNIKSLNNDDLNYLFSLLEEFTSDEQENALMVDIVRLLLDHSRKNELYHLIENNTAFATWLFRSNDDKLVNAVYDLIENEMIKNIFNNDAKIGFHEHLPTRLQKRFLNVAIKTPLDFITLMNHPKYQSFFTNPDFSNFARENITDEAKSVIAFTESGSYGSTPLGFNKVIELGLLSELLKMQEEVNIEHVTAILKILNDNSYDMGSDIDFEKSLLCCVDSLGRKDLFESIADKRLKLFLLKITSGGIELSKDELSALINSLNNQDIEKFDSIFSHPSLKFDCLESFLSFCDSIDPEKHLTLSKIVIKQQDSWINLVDNDCTGIINQFNLIENNTRISKKLLSSYRDKLVTCGTDKKRFRDSCPLIQLLDKLTKNEITKVVDHALNHSIRLKTSDLIALSTHCTPEEKKKLYAAHGENILSETKNSDEFERFFDNCPANFLIENYKSFYIERRCRILAYAFRLGEKPRANLTEREKQILKLVEDNKSNFDVSQKPDRIFYIKNIFPELMQRACRIFELLCHEQMAGSFRHRSTLDAIKIFLDKKKAVVSDWERMYTHDPLLQEAWRLANIIDKEERIRQTYLMVFKQTTFGISKATGKTLILSRTLKNELSKLNINDPDTIPERSRLKRVIMAAN